MAKDRGGFWIGFAAVVFHPVTALLARRVNRGSGRIPRVGGALLVMNHISHLDPLYDAVLVHQQGRVPRFLAKHTLWQKPMLGHVLKGAGQIPVYRGTADAQQSLREAVQALRDGKIVIIYPEGTITRDPNGWPMYARTGVARIALESDVPVIPVARWGTRSIFDHYSGKFRPFPRKVVTTVCGDPVDLAAFRGRPIDNQVLRDVTTLIMSGVRDLLGEIRDERPPARFYSPSQAKLDAAVRNPTPEAER